MLDTAIELIKTRDLLTHQERALVLAVLEGCKNTPEPEPQHIEIDGDVVLEYLMDVLVHKYAELYMENE